MRKIKRTLQQSKKNGESCFREVLDFSNQSVNYCRGLRTKLDNPSIRQRFLGNAEEETRHVSLTPT